MSILQAPRMFANKENSLLSPPSCMSTFHTSSSSMSKPGISGLGRSLRKRPGGHGSKPYNRTSSVHKPTTSLKNKMAKSHGSTGKTKKTAPPPLLLAKPVTKRPEIVVVQSQVQIPLSLPRVDIPMVPHLDDEFDHDVPFEYVRSRLLPRLAAFGIVSSQYRPYPTFTHSSPAQQSASGPSRPLMAFGVPAIVEGMDVDGGLAARMKGREPDLCLAITKKGESTLKVAASLVPVNKLVFASQCFHWSRLTSGLSAPPPEAVKQQPAPTQSHDELDTITEDAESEEMDELADDASETSSHSDCTIIPSHSQSPSPSRTHIDSPEPSPAPSSSTGPILHLPIQPLALPSPETYSHLHNLLHFTHSPPPSTFSPLNALLGMDVSRLHNLDNRELMQRLSVIQGVWKNCCYLGVGDVKVWNGMRDAWGAVVGIVAERSKKVERGMDMDH